MKKKNMPGIDHSKIILNSKNMKFSFISKQLANNDYLSKRLLKIQQLLKAVKSESSAFEREIKKQAKETVKLKNDALVAQNLITLSDDQVQAVRSVLKTALASDRKITLLLTILISAIFFVLGIIIKM